MQNNEILEHSIAIVHAHTRSRNIGVLCASQYGQPAEERDSVGRSLQNDLRDSAFGHYPVAGLLCPHNATPREEPVKDRFYLVIGSERNDSGNLKGFLRKMALKYDQAVVLYKPFDSEVAQLHHRDGRVESADQWHPERIGEFYAMLKGLKGTDLVFQEVHFLEAQTWFNRTEHDIRRDFHEPEE